MSLKKSLDQAADTENLDSIIVYLMDSERKDKYEVDEIIIMLIK